MNTKIRILLALSVVLCVSIALYISACVPTGGPGQDNMTLKKIKVSRGDFTYRESGRKMGDPVIMIHGWPENSYCWDAVAGHLDPSLHVIAPDLRGLGDSERTLDQDAYQKKELAKDIIAIADALGIDKFNLVGHDWGGIVAQEVAIQISERVNKLVILNIPIILNLLHNSEVLEIVKNNSADPFWYQTFQKQPNLPEQMIPGNEAVWVKHFFGTRPIPEKSINEYIRAYSIPNTPATAASLYRTMAQDTERWIELYTAGTQFAMPGLYIYGNLDTVIIPEYLEGIETCFPQTVRIEQLEASHFVQEEKPAEVAQLMNDFFLSDN